MSDTSYQEKSKGEGRSQNSDSNYSHKDYSGQSSHRGGKRYYDQGKPKPQSNDGYYEKGRDTRKKDYNYEDDEQQTQDSDHYYKKNYNNGGNSKYGGGNYDKQYNNAYPKGPRRPNNYQQTNVWKKKKENFNKIAKDLILEKFTELGEPNQAFVDIMESNPQLFSRAPQRPTVEEKFELNPDEGVTGRPAPTGQREVKEQVEEKVERVERYHEENYPRHRATNWDDGGDGNDFVLDAGKMDELLRGGNKPKDFKKGRDEEEKDDYPEEIEEPQKDPWDTNEDNGEFSNIDEIFERKLKENKLQFGDEDEVDFGLLKKGAEEEDGEAPVWGDLDAGVIKKETKEVENQLLSGGWGGDFNGGLGGGKSRFTTLENDSFDKKVQSSQRQNPFGPSDDEKQGFSGFQFEDSGDHDDFFRSMNPQKAKQSPFMQQPISLQHHIPQQQIPMQHLQQMQQMQQQYQAQQQMYNAQMAFTQSQPTPLPVGLGPMIPNVFSHFTNFGFKDNAWYYLDKQRNRQGPFTAKQMNEWYMGNHLPMDLLVTSGENLNFLPLKDLIEMILKPAGFASNPIRSPTMNYYNQPQVQSPVHVIPQQQQKQQQQQQQPQPQQQDTNADKSQFQFSQLLDNPMFQNLTSAGTTSAPLNIKTAEELEQQANPDSYGQYGNYKQPRKVSGNNLNEQSKKNQQHQVHPQLYSSPIGMLQPGMALPQELGNPAHLSQANQAKRKNSGNQKPQKKGGKAQQGSEGQPNSADMTDALKMALGIGASASDNGTEGLATHSKKKNVAPPSIDMGDFPSLGESNK